MLTGRGRTHHGDSLREATKLAEAGKLRPLLSQERFTFETAFEPHVAVEMGKTAGNIVVEMHDSTWRTFMSKVWLVTGSASGLGRTIAESVLASGDRLVATARDPSGIGRAGNQSLLKIPADFLKSVEMAASHPSYIQAAQRRSQSLPKEKG
jgi:hypothetical protein